MAIDGALCHPPARLIAAPIPTERLLLEPLRPEHADEMVGVLADERLHDFIGGRPLELGELRDRYRHLAAGRSADGRQVWLNWVVRGRHDGAAMGTVQATVTPAEGPRALVAWVIGTPWQRRGVATEAARALIEWLRDQGVRTIAAHVHPKHEASQQVARRVGLVPTDEECEGERVWRLPDQMS